MFHCTPQKHTMVYASGHMTLPSLAATLHLQTFHDPHALRQPSTPTELHCKHRHAFVLAIVTAAELPVMKPWTAAARLPASLCLSPTLAFGVSMETQAAVLARLVNRMAPGHEDFAFWAS